MLHVCGFRILVEEMGVKPGVWKSLWKSPVTEEGCDFPVVPPGSASECIVWLGTDKKNRMTQC